MRMRLLVPLAALSALVNVSPQAGAVGLDGVCTSLVSVCVGGCNAGQLVRVNVIGAGYGDAKCGDATAYCYSSGLLGCSAAQMTLTGGSSFIRCLADPAGSGPTIAICRVEDPIV